MPRVKQSIKSEVEQAEKVARKTVYRKKKRQQKTDFSSLFSYLGVSPEDVEMMEREEKPATPLRWVVDDWGNQGEVMFDGKLYWGTGFHLGDFKPIAWTPEEWEKRKVKDIVPPGGKENGREEKPIRKPIKRSTKREKASRPARDNNKTIKPTSKGKKLTDNKVGKVKSIPGTKRSVVSKKQRKVRKVIPKTKNKQIKAKTAKKK